ncbi:MAG: multicopper oxidase domain-containing protein, partial [Flavobacteriales bacterium]|nr:multicopper oxidase domain-containing protein [Flavobacteriales bacterium]
PHTKMLPGDTWSPDFEVLNEATTFWYHPHLHKKTEEHVYFGAAGLIIVEDDNSDTLSIPRIYGVDDIPMIIQDKKFDPLQANQLKLEKTGDSIMINGTLNPHVDVPAQMVRFRILNASTMRVYNVGLEGDVPFQMIASDGGFLESPETMTRLMVAPGERVEIVVDFSGLASGDSLSIISFNTELAFGVQGGPGGPFGYPNVDNMDFELLRCKGIAATAQAVYTLSPVLNSFNKWLETDADTSRFIEITGGMNQVFLFNDLSFDMNVVNETIYLDDIEIWEIHNTGTMDAHPFHIHDIQFFVLDINGVAPPVHLSGLKDVVLIEPSATVRFITKFETFADPIVPFMYHCHILTHEDKGMMGQFLVIENPSSSPDESIKDNIDILIYPNPTKETLTVNLGEEGVNTERISVVNLMGEIVSSTSSQGKQQVDINVNTFTTGEYILVIQYKNNSSYSTKFVIE